MNLAYHHISGAGAWWWPGLARLDCTTNTDITYYHLIKGSLQQTHNDHCEAQAETDTESTIRLKLIRVTRGTNSGAWNGWGLIQ